MLSISGSVFAGSHQRQRQRTKTQIAPTPPSVVTRLSPSPPDKGAIKTKTNSSKRKYKVRSHSVFRILTLWNLCKRPWLLCLDSIFSSPSNFNSNQSTLLKLWTHPIYSEKEQRCLIKTWNNSLVILLPICCVLAPEKQKMIRKRWMTLQTAWILVIERQV